MTATSCSLDPIQTNGNVRRSETLTQFSQSVSQVTHGSAQHSGRDKGFITSRDRQTSPHLNGREETHSDFINERTSSILQFSFCTNRPIHPRNHECTLVWSRPVFYLVCDCACFSGTRMAGQGLRLRLLFRARRVQCMSVPGILSCPEIPIIPGLYGICPKLCSLPVFCPQLSSVSLFSLEFLLPWKRKLHEHEIK